MREGGREGGQREGGRGLGRGVCDENGKDGGDGG